MPCIQWTNWLPAFFIMVTPLIYVWGSGFRCKASISAAYVTFDNSAIFLNDGGGDMFLHPPGYKASQPRWPQCKGPYNVKYSLQTYSPSKSMINIICIYCFNISLLTHNIIIFERCFIGVWYCSLALPKNTGSRCSGKTPDVNIYLNLRKGKWHEDGGNYILMNW